MTFSELNKSVAKNGRLPEGGRPKAAAVVRSADGAPNRNLGIDVRAPKRVTAKRADSVRNARG